LVTGEVRLKINLFTKYQNRFFWSNKKIPLAEQWARSKGACLSAQQNL
jgi:hypothetical protein